MSKYYCGYCIIYFEIKMGISSSSTIQFPNMVGFSGILFAWMVVSTLQTQQRTCPIPVFPDLCFDVYTVGGFSISLGPLVQLVFLQMILPRASFIGHLAGIIVGFAWHWNFLPSLEWIQPCILYPLAWIGGKYYVHRYHNNDDTTSNDDGFGRGHVLEEEEEEEDGLALLRGHLHLVRLLAVVVVVR